MSYRVVRPLDTSSTSSSTPTPTVGEDYLDRINRPTGGGTSPTPTQPTTDDVLIGGDSGKNYSGGTSTSTDTPKLDYVDPIQREAVNAKQETKITQAIVDTDFKKANTGLQNFIEQGYKIIAIGGAGYDWDKYEGGYAQFKKDVSQAEADLKTNQNTLTLFHYQTDPKTERELEIESQSRMLTPNQLHKNTEASFTLDAAKRLKDEGIISDTTIIGTVKVGDRSSSSSLGAAGLQLDVDPTLLTEVQKNDLKTLGFEIDPKTTKDYKPTAEDRATLFGVGVIGNEEAIMNKQANLFSKTGRILVDDARKLKLGGEDAKAGLYFAAGGAIGGIGGLTYGGDILGDWKYNPLSTAIQVGVISLSIIDVGLAIKNFTKTSSFRRIKEGVSWGFGGEYSGQTTKIGSAIDDLPTFSMDTTNKGGRYPTQTRTPPPSDFKFPEVAHNKVTGKVYFGDSQDPLKFPTMDWGSKKQVGGGLQWRITTEDIPIVKETGYTAYHNEGQGWGTSSWDYDALGKPLSKTGKSPQIGYKRTGADLVPVAITDLDTDLVTVQRFNLVDTRFSFYNPNIQLSTVRTSLIPITLATQATKLNLLQDTAAILRLGVGSISPQEEKTNIIQKQKSIIQSIQKSTTRTDTKTITAVTPIQIQVQELFALQTVETATLTKTIPKTVSPIKPTPKTPNPFKPTPLTGRRPPTGSGGRKTGGRGSGRRKKRASTLEVRLHAIQSAGQVKKKLLKV